MNKEQTKKLEKLLEACSNLSLECLRSIEHVNNQNVSEEQKELIEDDFENELQNMIICIQSMKTVDYRVGYSVYMNHDELKELKRKLSEQTECYSMSCKGSKEK